MTAHPDTVFVRGTGPEPLQAGGLRDAFVIGQVFLAMAVANLVPTSRWPKLTRRLSDYLLTPRPEKAAEQLARIANFHGLPLESESVREIARSRIAFAHEERLLVLRSFLRPGWRPSVELVGKENIEAALRRGRGTILWIAPFFFSGLPAKLAWSGHGLRVLHVSRPYHGFANSRLAVATVNRIWLAVESRHLSGSIVLAPDTPGPALRKIVSHLRGNSVVSIAVNSQGLRLCRTPLLNGHLTVATGACGLAWSTGAQLLPVATVRTEDHAYRTHVGEPLACPRTLSRSRAMTSMTEGLAEFIAPFAERYPGQLRIGSRLPPPHRNKP